MARALECCADHRGTPEPAKASDAHLQGAAGIWRNAFIRMPYAREFLTPAGLINDTFETAITWDQFENLHDKVKAGLRDRAHGARGIEERGETKRCAGAEAWTRLQSHPGARNHAARF